MPKGTENKPFFITTPIYYASGSPHIGHAYTTVVADCLARFKKEQGYEVFFSTGTDEHGQKIAKKAEEEGKEVRAFVDEMTDGFQKLWQALDIEYTKFIRTTDTHHIKAVQKVLQTLYDNGSIYQGFYEGLYCIGCEQFKTEEDLVLGKCPDHNSVPEFMREESYIMKMTELQDELIHRIETDVLCVTSGKYKTEILSFLKREKLEDVSISRKNVKWGIPLPFDEAHTTYVWVDAFLNYLTVLGWDGDTDVVPKEWPADVQIIGKDILRVHATIWPAVLMHLGIPTQKLLLTHGHILSGGKKMSKTMGNIIDPLTLVERFGVDGTRYLLMSAGTFGGDVDLTLERMTEKYNADLANGLGNLVSRVLKLAEQVSLCREISTLKDSETMDTLMNEYKFSEALQHIWQKVSEANKYIDEMKPWVLVTSDGTKFSEVMEVLLGQLASIAILLQPFMPETSEKIKRALKTGKVEPLFQRIK